MEEIAERTEEAVDSVLLGADDVTHSLYDVTYDVVIKTSTFIASYLIYLLIMCIVLDFWDKLKEPTKQFLRSKIEKYVDQRTLTEFFKQYTDRRTKGQDRDTPPNQPVVENKNSLILAETQSEAQIITEQQVDAPASEEWDSASQENYDDPVTAAEVSEVDDKETVVEKEDFDQIAAVVEKDDEIQVGNLVDIEDDSQIAAVEKEDEDQISAVVDEVQLLVDVDDQVTAVEKEDEDQISAVVEKEDDVQVLVEVVDQVTPVGGEDDQISAVVDDVQLLVDVDDQVTAVEKEDDQIAAVVEKEDDVQVLVEVDDQVTAVEKEDDQIAAVVEKEDDVQVLVEVDDQVTPVGGEDDQISAVVDDVQLLVEVDDQVTPVEGEDDQIAAVVEKEDVDHITAVVEKKYDVQEENLVDIEDDSQIAAVESETGRGQDNCEDISGVIEEDNQLVSGDKDKPLSEAEVEIFVQDTISKAVQQYQSEEQSKDA
ncbi:leucine-rich repeat and coiled-coil domain-containing protein PF3D7_0703800-like isoform X3 [Bolinopsis microptera]|uniref:leucine-rich repeat and coiled-coil domain-containing protein PF3D7_0703800-like isoform X3 n=1 Tax=Bolinopsis microptera TaxID=2820187 RepID=UPI00307A5DD7